jgi:acylphosphatase
MSAHSRLNQVMIGAAALASCVVVASAPVVAKTNDAGQNEIAVSGVVSGNVQQVGFRAMIQKQAIKYNLAGSAKNNKDKTVQFRLQGDKSRVNQALDLIRGGTKKSSNVEVTVSKVPVDSTLNTFTVMKWTSVSRHIKTPYDLVFTLRADNTQIKKKAAKSVWLEICNNAVKGKDKGKCEKDDD